MSRRADRRRRELNPTKTVLTATDRILSNKSGIVGRSNLAYLIIGALVVAVTVLSYQVYEDRKQPEGLHINIGPGGASVEGK
jgi:hypothetical protein